MVVSQERRLLVRILKLWSEKRSRLRNVDVRRNEVRRILSWDGWSWQSKARLEASRIGMIVVVSLVHRVLLQNSTVVSHVRSVVVVRSIIHVAEAIVEDRRNRWWRWSNARWNSIIDSVELVVDVLISRLIEAEDVCPLAGRQNRSRRWLRRWIRKRSEWRRRRRTNQAIVIVKQASLALHRLDRPLERVRRAGRLSVNDRHENHKVSELEVTKELCNN